MQKKKNLRLLTILILLVGVVVILLATGGNKNKISVSRDLFSVKDTALVTSITIEADTFKNKISKVNNQWWVNEKYAADERLVKVLLTILNKVTVRREIPSAQADSVVAELGKKGIKVTVLNNSNTLKSFLAGGNTDRTLSYFAESLTERPYIVHLPGYHNYLSGIFEYSESEWRDKLIFSSHWSSIKSVKVEYPQNTEAGFEILSKGNTFELPGISAMDTLNVGTLLNHFQYFEANAISRHGINKTYDSLINTPPTAIISLNDLNDKKSAQLSLFGNIRNSYLVGQLKDKSDIYVFSAKALQPLLKTKAHFQYRKK